MTIREYAQEEGQCQAMDLEVFWKEFRAVLGRIDYKTVVVYFRHGPAGTAFFGFFYE